MAAFFRLKTQRRAERENIMRSEYGASNFVPYSNHWDDHTIITKGGDLLQVVKVSGFSFETADDEDVDLRKVLRNMMLKSIASKDVGLYFHVFRKHEQAYPDDYESVDMPDGFAKFLDQRWFEKHRHKKAFINELYITVIRRAPDVNISSVTDFLNRLLGEKQEQLIYEKIHERHEELEEVMSRVLAALRDYNPRVLGLVKSKNGIYSEVCKFLGRIVNAGYESDMLVPSTTIDKYICQNRLYFGKRAIETKQPDGKSKYCAMLSIKEYGPRTWAGIFDAFLHAPFEFVMTQSFEFINRQVAINKMQIQQNRMIQAGDKAVSQIAEISEALDKAMSGEISFGNHHMSILVKADSLRDLEQVVSQAAVEITNVGSIPVRETVNMEPAFWGQLPGNYDFIVRKAVLNSLNLAAFNSFHNYPVGKAHGNHWGDAVTVLDTTSGTPYYFNFHNRDIGHTTIIGPTGAGKTVMMNFLCAQSQKFRCRLFFFDKDRGAEIFIRALNGNYTNIDPSKPCGFNPLQLPDNGENRTFLLDWLKQLVTSNGEELSSEDIALLSAAINGNYKLDKKKRRLRNIAPFLGMEGPGTLAGRLAMWHSKGSHSKVFDNDEDIIDFNISNVFGFEMADLLRDKYSLSPVLSYVFHRINMALDGTPTMIVLDEAWALIDNPVFAPRIKDWLKVLRKLNAFVIFATQSVEDAASSDISDTLIQQTATQIFLPNLKATEVYKSSFMLSNREFQIIKTTDPGSRFFLIKQGHDSVIARIDLSGMDDIINILSGRADTVILLDKVREQYGEDPEVWIPEFNKALRERVED
jgi:type IV secretion system protein VirB4